MGYLVVASQLAQDQAKPKFVVGVTRTGRSFHTIDQLDEDLELVDRIERTGCIGGICL